MAGAVGIFAEFNPSVDDWNIHTKRLEQYFIANKVVDDNIKRAMILNSLAQGAYKLLMNLTFPTAPENVAYKDIVKHLTSFYAPTSAIYPERYKFYAATKKTEETLQEWSARLRQLSTNCKFDTNLHEVLRDKFIMGLEAGKVRDRLFTEDETLTLAKALEISQSVESAQLQYGIRDIRAQLIVIR